MYDASGGPARLLRPPPSPLARAPTRLDSIVRMVAPGWQNKKKKTLKARDSKNARALKVKRGAKATHDAAKKRVRGAARTGKARRKALRNERRAARNAMDDEAKKASAENGGDVVME